YVARSLAQRGQQNGYHINAVIEVLAEAPGSDHFLEVFVGGGNEPEIDFLGRLAPDTRHRPILQHAQQLALQGQAQGGDLVQKQRPRMGEFDVSGPRRSRVRECTLLVPEQLGLDQVLGQGCTIDTYERLFGARTEGNDRSRYQLLACTAL